MLLKVGFVMMAFAAALAGAVVAVVSTEEPARSAAVKSTERRPAEPLKRTDPMVEPRREEEITVRDPERPKEVPAPERAAESEPKPEPRSEARAKSEVVPPEPGPRSEPEPQP